MQEETDIKIYFAPLKGLTDYIYRSAHAKFFGGIDKYFAPYITLQNNGTVKLSHLRDVIPENNRGYQLIPQILAGNSTDFVLLSRILTDKGYDEVNWNLGCPYPMVTNKGLGSGLLPYAGYIKSILEESLPKVDCRISIKMRTGLKSHDDIFNVIEILNEYPLCEIILHPRFGKQLYNGIPDPKVFSAVQKIIKHKIVYNGEIGSIKDLVINNELFNGINTWMIGRGILKNPFLPFLLRNGCLPGTEKKREILQSFYNEIFFQYSNLMNGKSHLLMKMENFWSYYCFNFPDPHKTFKRIKKAANIIKYEAAVLENFKTLLNYEED